MVWMCTLEDGKKQQQISVRKVSVIFAIFQNLTGAQQVSLTFNRYIMHWTALSSLKTLFWFQNHCFSLQPVGYDSVLVFTLSVVEC